MVLQTQNCNQMVANACYQPWRPEPDIYPPRMCTSGGDTTTRQAVDWRKKPEQRTLRWCQSADYSTRHQTRNSTNVVGKHQPDTVKRSVTDASLKWREPLKSGLNWVEDSFYTETPRRKIESRHHRPTPTKIKQEHTTTNSGRSKSSKGKIANLDRTSVKADLIASYLP